MQECKLKSDFEKHRESLKNNVGATLKKSRSAEIARLKQLLGSFLKRIESDDSDNLLDWIEDQRVFLSKLINDSNYFLDIRSNLNVWVESCTGMETYVQQDVCFDTQNSDSISIKSRKLVKRTGRKLSRGITATGNTFRKIVGKNPQSASEWTHIVNWDLVSGRVRNVVLEQMVQMLISDLQLRREIVLALVHVTDTLTSQFRTDDQNEAIKQEITSLENRLSEGLYSEPLFEVIDVKLDEILFGVTHLGTLTEPSTLKKSDRHQSEYTKLNSRIESIQGNWSTDIQTRLSQLRIDLGFHRFMKLIESEIQAFSMDVSRPFADVVIPAVQSVNMKLIKTADEFDREKIGKMTRASLGKKLKLATTELSDYLHSELDKLIVDSVNDSKFEDRLELTFAEIILKNNLLAGETSVFETNKFDSEKPNTVTAEIDFRQEMTVYLKHELFRKLKSVPAELRTEIDKTIKMSDEVVQIVEVNLNLADEMSKDSSEAAKLDELFALVHDGLDRAASRSRELSDFLADFIQLVNSSTSEPVRAFQELCVKIMQEDNYLYIRTKNREVRVKSTAVDWRSRIVRNSLNALDAVNLRIRYGAKVGKNVLVNGKKLLGFQVQSEQQGIIKTEASEFLANTDETLQSLPLIYRRLFTAEALIESRFYKGRNTLQQMFEQSFTTWKRENFSNFVIIGEKGSGKTTIFNQLERNLPKDNPIVRGTIAYTTQTEDELLTQLCEILNLKPVEDLASFIVAVNALNKRQIVFLEGFQNLYLRNIRGFAALEAFLLILSKTGTKCFWVVSSSRYGWQYLNKIYSVSGYFTHFRMVDQVPATVLEEVIMSRHSVSGYDLHFDPTEDMSTSRAFKKLAGDIVAQQALVRQKYFENLNKIAKGNISIAILYWQISVRHFDADTIYLYPIEKIKLVLGDGYSMDDLFALGALVLHDDLTVEQLSLALNQSDRKSRMDLARLTSQSILLHIDSRYYLNNLIYRPIVELLKSRNIIH